MPRGYFGCWNRTFGDSSKTGTTSEQTCDSKGAVAAKGWPSQTPRPLQQLPQAVARELDYPLKDSERTRAELGCLTRPRYVDYSARLTYAVINRDLQNRKTGFDFQCGRPRSFRRFE